MEVEHIREGGPTVCINCGKPLHRKSEYYCSQKCENKFKSRNDSAPVFLSKWKIRKRNEDKDPLISVRKKARTKRTFV